MAPTPPPLAGIRVLELGQYIAVPGAAQILADQGATVVKVEMPGGEPSRHLPGYGAAMIAAYNRNKSLVELDLKSPADQETARRLARASDVVLANFRPGTLEKVGLDAASLREADPALVHVSVTGFGAEGSMRTRAGLDIAAQAESGVMWVTGEKGGEPQRVGFPVIDAAATHVVAQAVTSALLGRAAHGEGATIEVSLWDVAIGLQATSWMDLALTGREPVRTGNGQPNVAPAAELVETSDGWIVLSAYTPRHWSQLCTLIDAPHLVDDPRFATSPDRVRHRPELHAALAAAFSHLTRSEAVALLDGAGLVCGAVNTYGEAKALRDTQPSSPFVPVPAPRDGDPDWLLGPVARWWDPLDVDVPGPSGRDNDRIPELLDPSATLSTPS